MSSPRRCDPRIKVEWAKKHIRQLDALVQTFMESDPCTVISETDPQTTKPVYRVKVEHGIPTDIQCLTGDILHNLRASLDHLVYSIMPLSVTWERFHGFPIFANANEYKARVLGKRGKVEGLPNNLVDRINALKPYKGGNDPLWRLNELNNIDKHRLLLTVVLAHDRHWLDWRDAFLETMPWEFELPKRRRTIIPLKNGAVLDTIRHNPEMDMEKQFAFLITFNELQIIQPEPVLPTLVQFADLVESVIAVFDDV